VFRNKESGKIKAYKNDYPMMMIPVIAVAKSLAICVGLVPNEGSFSTRLHLSHEQR
jgi:hypothetical protein